MTKRQAVQETKKHIKMVRDTIHSLIVRLLTQSMEHDQSKLKSPEFEIFLKYTPKLRNTTYGSDEYKIFLQEMKPALDHHYEVNRHHPEHFNKYVCNGCFKEFQLMPNYCDVCGYSQFQKESDMSQMNMLDLIEMFADWYSATKRHADGDIRESIKINTKRFSISEQLVSIMQNTADLLDDIKLNE